MKIAPRILVDFEGLITKDGIMTQSIQRIVDEGFAPPGTVKVSVAALAFARAFGETVSKRSGHWVVAFSWAEGVSVKHGRSEPYEDVGACLMLGAFERHEIPARFLHSNDGFEFAVQIPSAILASSAERLIDFDETQLFKLALR